MQGLATPQRRRSSPRSAVIMGCAREIDMDTKRTVNESLEVLAYEAGPTYAQAWASRPTYDEPYVVGTARQHLNTRELARLTLFRSRLDNRNELAQRYCPAEGVQPNAAAQPALGDRDEMKTSGAEASGEVVLTQ
jgi:hypothetical protein